MSGVANQFTRTFSVMASDRVTVKVALAPSSTSPLGPLMLRSARVLFLIVMVAGGATVKSLVDPFNRTVSSGSTMESVLGVKVRVPVP